MERWDIIVAGGGVAGMTAAAAFGAAGFSVLCVDPAAPVTAQAEPGADLRTTAFLQPARRLLARAGLWQHLEPHATPLQVMRIVDAGSGESEPTVHDFDAADVSDLPFGWNFPNWLLRRELVAHLARTPGVTLRSGTGLAGIVTRDSEARVEMSDGSRHSARLVIAADGRDSPTRRALGIGVSTKRYGQKALAFAVSHPIPHHNVSTEVHRSGGPFTLVPLPDHEGRPSSGVVWMEDGPEARRLAALDDAALADEMADRSLGLFGPLTPLTPRTLWPIITQRAERLTAERVALVAEAAHVVPPIGAQGLNMSLADIALLLDLAEEAPDDLGGRAMLDRYARRRGADIAARLAGIDLLNRASRADTRLARELRALGLKSLHGATPLRKAMMRLGLGGGSGAEAARDARPGTDGDT